MLLNITFYLGMKNQMLLQLTNHYLTHHATEQENIWKQEGTHDNNNNLSTQKSILCRSYYMGGGGLISVWLHKENNKLYRIEKIYLLYIFPLSSTHLWLYDFIVQTSLTQPRKILLVVLQIGKAKDLSAPLCSSIFLMFNLWRISGDQSLRKI
jgi:hypothetical protein